MCFFGLVSGFNIYVLSLFSQHHYQFSCWQTLWQGAQALWFEWALALLLVSSISFFYPFVFLMELKMSMAFLCVCTELQIGFFRVELDFFLKY